MNRTEKKKHKLHLPSSYEHSSNGEYMPIAEVTEITPENALRRESKRGHEMSE